MNEATCKTWEELMEALKYGRVFRTGSCVLYWDGRPAIGLLAQEEYIVQEVPNGISWRENKGDRFPDVKPSDTVSVIRRSGLVCTGPAQVFHWSLTGSDTDVLQWRKS